MQSYGTCQYEYTRNGELTRRTDSASGAVTNYQYDEFGNLRRVDLADARVVTYHIDGLNRRVGKSIDGVRQWGLLYANQLEPVAELDGAGNIVASFLYADRPHVPSLMLKGGHTYRILSDHLGSVRLVIDINDGSIAQRLAYDEYGNVIEDTNPGFQPFAYAGGLYDPDTHLTRFGARDYDAVAGRWTAKDQRRIDGLQTNFYAYANHDPVNWADVDGQQAFFLAQPPLMPRPAILPQAIRAGLEQQRLRPGPAEALLRQLRQDAESQRAGWKPGERTPWVPPESLGPKIDGLDNLVDLLKMVAETIRNFGVGEVVGPVPIDPCKEDRWYEECWAAGLCA
jgi:RHS repeat-associated protein